EHEARQQPEFPAHVSLSMSAARRRAMDATPRRRKQPVKFVLTGTARFHLVTGFAVVRRPSPIQPPRCSSAATAGRVLPSRNSRNAPPPVEMYDTSSAMPYLSTAARVSPPPAIENACEAAIARARVSVPLPNASNSNTPTGPFQTTVPALAIMSA